MKNKLIGVNGWLLFYVVLLSLNILSIFIVLISVFTYSAEGISSLLLHLIVQVCILALIIYSLILIIQKKKKAIKWNIRMLWFLFFSLTFVYLVDFLISDTFRISEVIGRLVFVLIWTNYLKKSRRVKDTLVR